MIPTKGLKKSEKVRDVMHADLLVKKPKFDEKTKSLNDIFKTIIEKLEVIHAGWSFSADQTQVSRRSKTADTQGSWQRPAQPSLEAKMSRNILASLKM